MLIETDAPYLAPVPHRGKTNQPAWVAHTAQFLADLRDEPVDRIGRGDLRQRAGGVPEDPNLTTHQ